MLLVACASALPAPVHSPPTISAVGVATDERVFDDHVSYAFADGSVQDVPATTRQVADGPAGLGIIGSDGQGPFVAAFPTQRGLPPDCYRDNAVGIERSDFIETRGILWAKAPDFTSPTRPAPGSTYPPGARFCFNARGQISAVIGG